MVLCSSGASKFRMSSMSFIFLPMPHSATGPGAQEKARWRTAVVTSIRGE
jgi:hypothetical protein